MFSPDHFEEKFQNLDVPPGFKNIFTPSVYSVSSQQDGVDSWIALQEVSDLKRQLRIVL